MSLISARQLSKQLESIAANHPFQPVQEGIAISFNLVLSEAKKDLPDSPIVHAVQEANKDTRFADLSIRAGLIATAYEEKEGDVSLSIL